MAIIENRLLGKLPRKDRLRLLARSDRVDLVKAAVLQEAREATTHVYFPGEGSIALLVETSDCASLEVAMVGVEAMTGAHLVLGRRDSPQRAIVQTGGWAIRVDQESFRQELTESVALRKLLHSYLYLLMNSQAGMVGCIHFHRIAPRLASWLLRCHDRAQADAFDVTHAFMASMLGVRRVSITNAAGSMQSNGLIRYHRGEFEVLDRPGLEKVACACYARERDAYNLLLG